MNFSGNDQDFKNYKWIGFVQKHHIDNRHHEKPEELQKLDETIRRRIDNVLLSPKWNFQGISSNL